MLKIRSFLEYNKCIICNLESLTYTLRKINKTEYICENCRRSRDYSTRNTNIKGKTTSTISYSFEFETDSRANELYELGKFNFIGCGDCSINGLEWKSPIFYSRKAFHNTCKKIDKFAKYVGRNCGTHLHVSTPYKMKLEQYKRELFEPILHEMISNKERTTKFWGRYFNSYCSAVIGNTRYNAFNTMSSVQTLEFRLLKYRNAEQYIRACDFCIDTTKFLNRVIGRDDINLVKARKIGEIILEKYKEVIKDV